MIVCVVLVSIIIINKNSLYLQGKDLERLSPQGNDNKRLAKSALGLEML